MICVRSGDDNSMNTVEVRAAFPGEEAFPAVRVKEGPRDASAVKETRAGWTELSRIGSENWRAKSPAVRSRSNAVTEGGSVFATYSDKENEAGARNGF